MIYLVTEKMPDLDLPAQCSDKTCTDGLSWKRTDHKDKIKNEIYFFGAILYHLIAITYKVDNANLFKMYLFEALNKSKAKQNDLQEVTFFCRFFFLAYNDKLHHQYQLH